MPKLQALLDFIEALIQLFKRGLALFRKAPPELDITAVIRKAQQPDPQTGEPTDDVTEIEKLLNG